MPRRVREPHTLIARDEPAKRISRDFRNQAARLPLQVMPRYHFDLVSSEEVTDVTGAILDDDEQAEKVALGLAVDVREAKPEFIGKGYEIVVRTEDGNEIFRVSIDRVPGRKNGP
jgi:hypothetical protein